MNKIQLTSDQYKKLYLMGEVKGKESAIHVNEIWQLEKK